MNIRPMTETDREAVISMMSEFYSSPAVETDGSEEIFKNDVDACVSDLPYAEGYVFICDDGICGYAMLAKSFSTEYGKPCVWIEDLYLKPDFRKKGIGGEFFRYIKGKYVGCVLRLEAEENNTNAVGLYRKSGFTKVPYLEMWITEN